MQKKSNKKSKSKARKVQRRGKGRRGESLSSAPVAVSDNLQQFVRFAGGKNSSNLRVSTILPLFQICSNSRASSADVIGSFLVTTSSASEQFDSICLSSTVGLHNPVVDTETIVDYISPILQLLGTAFVRYKIDECRFIYEPQSSTTVDDRLVFAFAEDPDHPLIVPPDGEQPTTQDNLLALSTSVAFAPWRSWSLDVSRSVKQDLLYTFNESGNDTNRFTFFGSMGCVSSKLYTGTTVSPTVYGVLYMRVTFEFVEFCPIIRGFTPTTTAVQTVQRSRVRKRCRLVKGASTSSCKEDDERCESSESAQVETCASPDVETWTANPSFKASEPIQTSCLNQRSKPAQPKLNKLILQ